MIYLIMGVAGCGKSSVGAALARRLDSDFIEGDDFHSAANIDKMSGGLPLDDDDRAPWLYRLAEELAARDRERRPAVLACSALKKQYRRRLTKGLDEVRIVYLRGNAALFAKRLGQREGHFIPPSLVASQCADLEEPTDEEALILDCSLSLDVLVAAILS